MSDEMRQIRQQNSGRCPMTEAGYSFEKPKPKIVQWLCGVFTNHADRNCALKDKHCAYCLHCGRIFGYWWGSK